MISIWLTLTGNILVTKKEEKDKIFIKCYEHWLHVYSVILKL